MREKPIPENSRGSGRLFRVPVCLLSSLGVPTQRDAAVGAGRESATRNMLIRTQVSMWRRLMTRDVNTKRCVCLRRSKLPKVFIAFCNRKGLRWHSTCWFATQTPESAPSENVLSLLNYVATPHQSKSSWVTSLACRWFQTELLGDENMKKKKIKDLEELLSFVLGV